MSEQEWAELEVESKYENLEVIGEFISKTMRGFGVKENKDIFDVQLSVDEACTNIIEHAYTGIENGKIWIKCKISESKKEFTVKIIDTGKAFNPNSIQTPDTKAELEDRKAGGLGIFFMKQKMQSIKYAFEEKQNIITMKKFLT
ncbi:MAG: ATP-binding protein [Crenarchaeota archaeon]|nr:ATP-binding protein [Thermoproteota archaeon]